MGGGRLLFEQALDSPQFYTRWHVMREMLALDAEVELAYDGTETRSARGTDGPVKDPDALRAITVRA